jgi:hypothetical protein
MRESDVDVVADLVTAAPLPNPRPVTRAGVVRLLLQAWRAVTRCPWTKPA